MVCSVTPKNSTTRDRTRSPSRPTVSQKHSCRASSVFSEFERENGQLLYKYMPAVYYANDTYTYIIVYIIRSSTLSSLIRRWSATARNCY